MTDKQIMIDGVDISGCKNFSCGKCEEENKIPKTINHFTADCRMYPNCYYKQLARKTAECEKYEQALEEVYGIIVRLLIMKDVKHLSKEINDILECMPNVVYKDGFEFKKKAGNNDR